LSSQATTCYFYRAISFDESYGEWILKFLSFIGPYGCQYGIYHIDDHQGNLKQSGNARWPKQPAKPKIVTTDMYVKIVEIVQVAQAEKVPIKNIGPKTDKERYAYQTHYYRVEQHADLKVQCLLAIVIDKRILFFIGGPQNKWKNKISEGYKVLRKGRCMNNSRQVSLVFGKGCCHF
tara:strand:- start:447 stop:977 length:531 start_codon:yes stop_codon:yes gene_type:complete